MKSQKHGRGQAEKGWSGRRLTECPASESASPVLASVAKLKGLVGKLGRRADLSLEVTEKDGLAGWVLLFQPLPQELPLKSGHFWCNA